MHVCMNARLTKKISLIVQRIHVVTVIRGLPMRLSYKLVTTDFRQTNDNSSCCTSITTLVKASHLPNTAQQKASGLLIISTQIIRVLQGLEDIDGLPDVKCTQDKMCLGFIGNPSDSQPLD